MIDKVEWSRMDADVKGDIYEGLLEKNAEDTKSWAGQYFTPRALIQAMVECVSPEPLKTIHDLLAELVGSFRQRFSDTRSIGSRRKEISQDSTFSGNEIVASTRRLCLMNMFLHGIGEMDGILKYQELTL